MDNKQTPDKKLILENLSREELINKCKTLLSIVHKAKLSKSLLQEEINQLKCDLESAIKKQEVIPATNEIIENLTQQKLDLVTNIEDLKVTNNILNKNLDQFNEEKKQMHVQLNNLDNENVALKKQLTRLNDENAQLIVHLDSLENQIHQLNEIGLEQQKQLLKLEEKNTHNTTAKENEKIQELEKMLKISLDEIKRMKDEKDKTCVSKVGNEESELNNINNKLKEKLKNYHSKIVKLAKNIQEIKSDKENLLTQFKTYINQVRHWRGELDVASKNILHILNSLQSENENLNKENNNLKQLNNQYVEQLETYKTDDEKSKDLELKNSTLQNEIDNINKQLHEKNVCHNIENENIELRKQINELFQEDCIKSEKFQREILDLTTTTDKLKEVVNNQQLMVQDLEHKNAILKNELEKSLLTEKKLAEKSSEEMLKLVEEVAILTKCNVELNEKLEAYDKNEENIRHKSFVDADTQTENESKIQPELEEQIVLLKSENSQLLFEMNEMNQELKERGENVSKLEAHCKEIKKKMKIYETQANTNVNNITEREVVIKELNSNITEKDKIILDLKNEIDMLKDKVNSNYESVNSAEVDIISTSTISRAEEIERLKDLEGSWEEKYGKLKNLAIKLKAKLREQTSEMNTEKATKTELHQKLNNAYENLKKLQTQHDYINDEMDKAIKQCQDYSKKEKTLEETIKKKDDIILEIQTEIKNLKEEKLSTDTWKKQISVKVQALRKELEEKEATILSLKSDLESKDQALKCEIENHKKTMNSLQHYTNENKKHTVLNLEMQDYEKSVKDLSSKLEKRNKQFVKMKEQFDSQKKANDTLIDQNNNLLEKINHYEKALETVVDEKNAYLKKLSETEETLQTKEDNIANLYEDLEKMRSQNEELSTNLSADIAKYQKIIDSLTEGKENLYAQNLEIQLSHKELQQKLFLREEELSAINKEFENYKIRAQSVLRQNQNRDIGLEEKLNGNVSSLLSQIEILNSEINELRNSNTSLENLNATLKLENTSLSSNNESLTDSLEDIKDKFEKLQTKFEETTSEHNDTVKSLKVHADTLSQCYRQQLSDQEVRHNREIIELQSRIEKSQAPAEINIPSLPSMTREDGEGSESTDNTANLPLSLEKLLSEEDEHKENILKKQISEQESKLHHLTELLADAEQDLAKHIQMNKVLKEEIRRQQRAVEREKHAENLEYLKNVILKFVTLHNGDERSRMVPVLNTILKLSPEETKKLEMVSKGDPGLKAWSSYLPVWSSSNKS